MKELRKFFIYIISCIIVVQFIFNMYDLTCAILNYSVANEYYQKFSTANEEIFNDKQLLEEYKEWNIPYEMIFEEYKLDQNYPKYGYIALSNAFSIQLNDINEDIYFFNRFLIYGVLIGIFFYLLSRRKNKSILFYVFSCLLSIFLITFIGTLIIDTIAGAGIPMYINYYNKAEIIPTMFNIYFRYLQDVILQVIVVFGIFTLSDIFITRFKIKRTKEQINTDIK